MWFEIFNNRSDKIGKDIDEWLATKNHNVAVKAMTQTESVDVDGFTWIIISIFWEWRS